MIDQRSPYIVVPETEDEEDPRARLALPLSVDARTAVVWLATPEAESEAIAHHHRRRFVDLTQIERRVIDDINERLPQSAHVAPFSLLPPAIWETERQARLMSWGMVPVHPYLNMYLPRTEAGYVTLHLPPVPQTYPDSYTEGALREVGAICARYEEQRGTPPEVDADEAALEDWLAHEETCRLDAVEEILMLAEFLARRLLGNEIVERHEGLFGAVMKRAMGFPPGLLMERV